MFDIREINIVIELWCMMFCVIGIVCALMLVRRQTRYRGIVVTCFALEFIAAGGDAAAGIYRGQTDELAWYAVHIGNFATFACSFLLLAAITHYVCARIDEATGHTYRPWHVLVILSSIAMCALAANGMFYTIDAGNLYVRNDLYWVSLAYAVFVSLVNAALILRYNEELEALMFAFLLVYAVVPILAAFVQVYAYGLNFIILIGAFGSLALFLEMQIHMSRRLARRTKQLVRAEAEANESRVAVMVSQIQPHFLFNTLDTIYGLCDEDVEQAKAAIASFSRYLRTNLDSLKRTTPVPIETEMKHVQTYLELEQMSDAHRISYDLDMRATGFAVPTLSVQTLAENAVKHGLGAKEDGGTVRVSTDELPDEFTVTIVDDGVGFDPTALDTKGMHVGIENTRSRLAAMCDGTLDIESEPGHGATVVMHIPKRGGR